MRCHLARLCASPAKKAAEVAFRRCSPNPRRNQQALGNPYTDYLVCVGIWLFNENRRSAWRIIVKPDKILLLHDPGLQTGAGTVIETHEHGDISKSGRTLSCVEPGEVVAH